MLWNVRVPVINGATDADPITAPGSVPSEKIIDLRQRAPENSLLSNRLMACLQGLKGQIATAGETVTFELYALDADDESELPADRRWVLLWTATLTANIVSQTRLGQTNEVFAGGGRFYFRVTAETVGVDREVVLKAGV